MANRNGLNHKIRGQKGVGFNRALPAAFGFDRSFKPTNGGYLSIPRIVGAMTPAILTVEFWAKPLSSLPAFNGYFSILDNSATRWAGQTGANNTIQIAPPVAGNVISDPLTLNSWNHFIIRANAQSLGYTLVQNGNVASPKTNTMLTPYTPAPISSVRINNNSASSGTMPLDEFRLYDRLISDSEIITNYNAGRGNNASITDGMRLWFKFEEFEILDFSLLQDGSNMQVGVRDFSGQNNHALPVGTMDINPLSPTYVFQPL